MRIIDKKLRKNRKVSLLMKRDGYMREESTE